jgi:protein CLEC16A
MPHISDSVRKLATTSSTNEQQSNDDSNEEGGSSGVAVASAPENGIESPQNSADDNSTQNEESAAEQSEEIIMNNKTDDEKYRQMSTAMSLMTRLASSDGSSASAKKVEIGILFDALIQHLNNQDYNEMTALLALSFIFTLFNNSGVSKKYIDLLKVKLNSEPSNSSSYHDALMSKLIGVVSKAVESDFKVRLVTLELAIKLIKSLAETNGQSYTNDFHLACIEQAREQSAFLLRRQYKTEEMFLDMFEHEYQSLNAQQTVSFEFLLRDWSILLTPTSTPLSGIEFSRRFPCGDTEKLKQTIRIFFLLRDLCINLTNEKESQLPLTKQEHLVKENDVLDLSSSDLIACTVSFKEK